MKKIPLTQNKYAIVDDEDFEFLSQYRWHYTHYGYAARRDYSKGGNGVIIYMHKLLLKGKSIDHINNQKLDNRKINLRIANKSANGCNRGKQNNNTSGYKGVYFNKTAQKWQAFITYKKESHYLGLFSQPVEAALIYNKKALELHGKFANLNNI
jgi:hypothetical protein